MKKLSLTIISTLMIIGSSSAHALPPEPAQTSPGYLLVLGRSTDRAKIIQYSMTLPPIYAATGGRYIGIGRPGGGVTCISGLCEGRSAVVATWADDKKIGSFWWGEAYRQAIKLRDNAGVFTVVGLKGVANVAPFEGGALLVANFSGATESDSPVAWLAAASDSGARLLVAPQVAALTPLEGDALYNRVALLSFASKEARDKFGASEATKALIKNSAGLSLVALIAVDAPAPATK